MLSHMMMGNWASLRWVELAPSEQMFEVVQWTRFITRKDPRFLFSINSWRLLAFLRFVEGEDDFFLTSVGIRAEVVVSAPLESKEQENCPLVRWKLKPIFGSFTSAWMKARHCVAKDWSWFPLTWGRGVAILAVESRRYWGRAHSALRVRR